MPAVVASRVSGVKSVENDLIIKSGVSRRDGSRGAVAQPPHPRGVADIRSPLRRMTPARRRPDAAGLGDPRAPMVSPKGPPLAP